MTLRSALTFVILFSLSSLVWAGPCGNGVPCVADLEGALGQTPTVAQAPAPVTTLAANAFESQGLRAEVLQRALTAFNTAWQRGDTQRKILTVIDYSLPSNQRRLWVINLETNTLLFHEYVAHGRGSGRTNATQFSNTDSSHQSNLGLLRTAETYQGKHGYSLRLDGLESGYNSNARARAIVVHAADYVSAAYARQNGRVGNSHGCPAVDPAVSRRLIDTIKGGTLIFGYYPDSGWLSSSRYLNPR